MTSSSENPLRYYYLIIVIVFMLLFGMCVNANAQKYERNGTEFVQQTNKTSAVKTKYTWIDADGKEYPIYLTAKSCYVIKISKKTGKEYKRYLNKEIFKEIKKELKNTQK